MAVADAPADTSVVFDRQQFDVLVDVLLEAGYRVIAPKLRDGVVGLDEIEGASDIAQGVVVETAPAHYRAEPHRSVRLFEGPVGPDSAKRWIFPPSQELWLGHRTGRAMTVSAASISSEPLAILGLRPCDLRAIAVLDRVLLGGPFPDRQYAARREKALLISVDCSEPAATCFCDSMGGGCESEAGYDVRLVEEIDEVGHRFHAMAGSTKGRTILERFQATGFTVEMPSDRAGRQSAHSSHPHRSVDRERLKELLYRRAESPRWKEIAARCLACGNCTMVCPTCFCTTIDDRSRLDGSGCERTRHWDSCFNIAFSYIHGGAVRQSVASRYRQWLTHKFAAWEDQFGVCGCVGCGRCIAWCPAGIDVTEELAAFRDEDAKTMTR